MHNEHVDDEMSPVEEMKRMLTELGQPERQPLLDIAPDTIEKAMEAMETIQNAIVAAHIRIDHLSESLEEGE